MAQEIELRPLKYVDVAASQTAKVLAGPGGTGALGDVIESVLIVPEVIAAGAVTLIDGTGSGATSRTLYVGGGTTTLPAPVPFTVVIGTRSLAGPWQITDRGLACHVMAMGRFT